MTPVRLFSYIKKGMAGLKDARRRSGNYTYRIEDVAMAIMVGMLRGCETFKGACRYIEGNRKFLNSVGLFTNKKAAGRVPDVSSVYRIAAKIDAKDFSMTFYSLMGALCGLWRKGGTRVLAVDGKRLLGTACGKDGRPLNILTAYEAMAEIPLQAAACDVKSNEITAWDELLDKLGSLVRGVVVTADAMACQTNIARRIFGAGGHYCLAVKGNQRGLEEDVAFLRGCNDPIDAFVEEEACLHGRREHRERFVYEVWDKNGGSDIGGAHNWAGLSRVVVVKAYRQAIRMEEGKPVAIGGQTVEERFYISDLKASAEEFNLIIRSHWKIESFHWKEDVVMGQDDTVRIKDRDSSRSEVLDTLQKGAYCISTLYEKARMEADKSYLKLGTAGVLARANCDQKFLREVLLTDISAFLAG